MKPIISLIFFTTLLFSSEISIDKARYNPGDDVVFNLSLDSMDEVSNVEVRYYHCWHCIDSLVITADSREISWYWSPPMNDFKGYLVLVKHNEEQIEIAVDVSSDWTRFPRYGFLSKFPAMFQSQIDLQIENLNRHHINGLQFYDWHWKHHRPLAGNPTNPDATWPDIANRTIYRATVENYIKAAHNKNMVAMAYNLLYGAYENATSDGVSETWRMYHDKAHQQPVMHDLPDSWASDIYVMDHTNSIWQNYIATQMRQVFQTFDFDGWHVDQLGSDGSPKYTYNGDAIWEASGFKGFLNKMDELLEIPMVMNAVDQFGTNYISETPVKFLYTEVWSESTFSGLAKVINNNRFYSAKKQSVLAAYVNKNFNGSDMNPAAVLLADAVIFANGGAHLELGEHLLCSEYFPYDALKTSGELKNKLIKYYDFATAYENLLRDSLESFLFTAIGENGYELSKSSQKNTIWVSAKRKKNIDLVHFINHYGIMHLDWRDSDGTQKMPNQHHDIPVLYRADSTVNNVYLCSPDFKSISMKPIAFSQNGYQLSFTLDSLIIWDMVVIEYDNKSTDVDTDPEKAAEFLLFQNYPNPFNCSTKIKFYMPARQTITFQVFDNCGKLISEATTEAEYGYNEFRYDSRSLCNGIYFYRISNSMTSITKKMILLK
ncbi:MAG: T9SS type A sorting domain-containing protein [Candidatus Marinimicrobia bacterium]|nr:T9SS type A sorting domain-containing protein [Candidatus Neomarinimicrobiota bacterium]